MQPWNDGNSYEPEATFGWVKPGVFRTYATPLVIVLGALLAVGLSLFA